MICTVSVTSTKLKIKYSVLCVMVKATPWIDTRKGQRGTKECVAPYVGIIDQPDNRYHRVITRVS
jgi:hypothetical protein